VLTNVGTNVLKMAHTRIAKETSMQRGLLGLERASSRTDSDLQLDTDTPPATPTRASREPSRQDSSKRRSVTRDWLWWSGACAIIGSF
jgi:hypothetical protein